MFLKTLFITCYQYLSLSMLLVLLVLIPNSYSFYLPLLYSVHIYYQHPLLVLTANTYCQYSLLVLTTKYALLVLTASIDCQYLLLVLTASTYHQYFLLVLTNSTYQQKSQLLSASFTWITCWCSQRPFFCSHAYRNQPFRMQFVAIFTYIFVSSANF